MVTSSCERTSSLGPIESLSIMVLKKRKAGKIKTREGRRKESIVVNVR